MSSQEHSLDEAVRKIVHGVIAGRLELKPKERQHMTRDSRLIEDLSVDSMDRLAIGIRIQEKIEKLIQDTRQQTIIFLIPEEKIEEAKTVGEVEDAFLEELHTLIAA